MAQHGETGIYILEAELKIDASQNVKGKECLPQPRCVSAGYMGWKCHKVQAQTQ